MAFDKLTTFEKITKLQASNADTKTRLPDQWVAKFGSSRKSDIRAKIGDNGQPYEELVGDYIRSL